MVIILGWLAVGATLAVALSRIQLASGGGASSQAFPGGAWERVKLASVQPPLILAL
jgi:hypothetical protein